MSKLLFIVSIVFALILVPGVLGVSRNTLRHRTSTHAPKSAFDASRLHQTSKNAFPKHADIPATAFGTTADKHPAAAVWNKRCDELDYTELPPAKCKEAFVDLFNVVKSGIGKSTLDLAARQKNLEDSSPAGGKTQWLNAMVLLMQSQKDLQDKSALWCGGIVCSDYAVAQGKRTLESQPMYAMMDGIQLTPKDKTDTWSEYMGAPFKALSYAFASSLSGTVDVYVRKWDYTSFYATTERRAILHWYENKPRNKVAKLIFHVVGPLFTDCAGEAATVKIAVKDMFEYTKEGKALAPGAKYDGMSEKEAMEVLRKLNDQNKAQKGKDTCYCNAASPNKADIFPFDHIELSKATKQPITANKVKQLQEAADILAEWVRK